MTRKKNELWEWLKALLIAVLLAVVIRTFLFAPIVVDGLSMMPTLHNHNRMIVSKFGEPDRFDIVVFHATKTKDYIKRVIGLPGDHVEYKNDILYVNGKAYPEPYLDAYKKQVIDGPLTQQFSVDVPKGHIFVMGDNRRNSNDSRHIGPISLDKVIGTTSVVYWPVADMKIVK